MRVREIVETVGIVGLLGSVLLLTFEIRQSNDIAKSEITQQILSEAAGWHTSIMESPDLAALLVMAKERRAEFSPVEQIRINSLCYRVFDTWLSVQMAYDNGQMRQQDYEDYLNDPRATMGGYPATKAIFKEALAFYPRMAASRMGQAIIEAAEVE